MRRIALLLLAAAAVAGEDDRFARPLDWTEGLPSDTVFDLCAAGPDRVWAATAAGLCRIEVHGIERAPVPGVPLLLAAAPGGAVYALYATEILLVDDEVRERIPLPVDPARAQAGAMDFADGVLRLRIDGRGWTYLRGAGWSEAGPPPEARGPVEHRGEVWEATRGRGILRRRKEPLFRSVEIPGASRVHALARDPDGAIWCGTENGVAKVANGTVETIREIGARTLGTVTAVAVDDDGRVWIGSGSSFPGVYRIAPQGTKHLDTIAGYVHRITKDAAGVLWFAVLNAPGAGGETGHGACSYSGGTFQPIDVQMPSARVYDVVARDPSGVLWFATLRGLAAYEGFGRVTHYTPESADLPGEKVWCLCAARDGALWIGYQQAHGVSRLAGGEFRHFGVEDGLCDGNVWAIAEGQKGVLWFANASGLSRYDGRRWSCFRDEEGLGTEGIWPLLPLPDGSLWIGTLGAGLVHMVPRDREPPRTSFATPARADGEVEVSWTGTDAWYETPRADLRYRWRLDGGRWSDATAQTSLTLRPGPGEHVLEVQAMDRFGNVEDPPAALTLGAGVPDRAFPWGWAVGGAALVLGVVIGRLGRRRGS